MEIKEKVSKFIKELVNEVNISNDENLFENGLLNSIHVLDLIAFIEDTFSIDLMEDDIDMNSFGSINNIVEMLDKKIVKV